jgi:hypothetical protein
LKLLIEPVDALVAFEINHREFLDHLVFLRNWDLLELVNLLLDVPEPAVCFG